MRANNIFLATIVQHKEIARKVFESTFHIDGAFQFIPGQYVWVVLPQLIMVDPKGERRAFSISSAPRTDGTISITYRDTGSGYKSTLLAMKPGEKLEIIGPQGTTLTLQEYDSKDFVAIVGGTGIAPYKGIGEWLSQHPEEDKKLVVVHTNKDLETMPHLEDMKSLAKKTKQLKYIPRQENFHWAMLPKLEMLKKPHIFIIGPQTFVDAVNKDFLDHGYEKKLLHFETYYPDVDKQSLNEIMKLFYSLENPHDILGAPTKKPNEKLLALLTQGIKNSSNHTVITDCNGYIMYANEAAQRTTGFTMSEMYDQTPRLWGGRMSKDFYKKLWESKLSGKIVNTELTNRRKNGELYECVVHITPITNANKDVIGYFAVEQDIEQLKATQRKMSEQEERLQFALKGGKRGVWDRDFAHNTVIFSRELKQILGFEESELKDDVKEWTDRIHPDDKNTMEQALQKHLAGKSEFFECEFRMLCKDQNYKWILAQGKLVSQEKGKQSQRMVGTFTDITSDKNKEVALEKQNRDLERLNKLMIGRELRMIELKKEIENLKTKNSEK